MAKATIGIIGIILFIFSIFFGSSLVKDERGALARDSKKTIYGMVSEDTPPMCEWAANLKERVITENKSQAVLIDLKNTQDKECESTITLRAPGFDISPVREDQIIKIKSKNHGSLSWILTPRKSGSFEISISDVLNTKVFGITVTNTFGLTAAQGKLAAILGSLFGPMFTVPWWVEKIWQKKKQKNESAGILNK